MELRQLRYFLEAAERLNFTQAARAVHITQSTLSQQLGQLEDELGTRLFDRIGKRVVLTEAGQYFIPYARQTVNSSESGRQILRDLAGLQTGTLLVGVTYALRSLLTPALIAFAQTCPGVYVNVRFGTSHELLEALRQSQLDLVLTFPKTQQPDTFVYQRLFESRLALIVARTSPLTDQATIGLTSLGHLPLALPVRGYGTRQFLDDAFAQAQVTPDIRLEINDVPTLLDLVRTGHWHTILSMATVEGHSGLYAVAINEPGMARQASLVWRASSYRKASAQRLAELITRQAEQRLDLG